MASFLTRESIRRAFGDGPAGAVAARLARPSARFQPVDDPGRADVQLGGVPLLPDGLQWPVWNGLPLDFVADVDLAGLHRVLDGALEPRSRPGWRVLLVPGDADRRPAEPPPIGSGVPRQVRPVGPFPAAHGELVGELTVPDPFESGMPPAWDDDAVFDGFEALELTGWSGPFHRVGGWPQPTQSAPAAPVALAAAGLGLGRRTDQPRCEVRRGRKPSDVADASPSSCASAHHAVALRDMSLLSAHDVDHRCCGPFGHEPTRMTPGQGVDSARQGTHDGGDRRGDAVR